LEIVKIYYGNFWLFFWLLNIQEVERNLFLILSGKYFPDRIIGYINFIIQEKFNPIFIYFYSE